MTNKTFKVAGITTHGDSSKVRFTDDMIRRVKQFTKGGASRVDLVELPNPMTKVEALKYLQAHEAFQSPSDQSIINDAILDRDKTGKPKEVKVKVPKSKKPSLENIKARAKKKVDEAELAKAIAEVGSSETSDS